MPAIYNLVSLAERQNNDISGSEALQSYYEQHKEWIFATGILGAALLVQSAIVLFFWRRSCIKRKKAKAAEKAFLPEKPPAYQAAPPAASKAVRPKMTIRKNTDGSEFKLQPAPVPSRRNSQTYAPNPRDPLGRSDSESDAVTLRDVEVDSSSEKL